MKQLSSYAYLFVLIVQIAATNLLNAACNPCAIQVLKEYNKEILDSSLIKEIQDILLIASSKRAHPLLTECKMDLLFDIAQNTKAYITQRWPGQPYKIFSLGQSPAWLMQMMQLIDQTKGIKDAEYGFIAFSSSFFEYDAFKRQYKRSSNVLPQNIRAYSEYLNTIGLKNTGNAQTIILEFPHHGQALRSFQSVAENYLPANFNFLISSMLEREPLYGPIQILNFITPKMKTDLIVPLANSDVFDDRLVMRYPHFDWATKDPLKFIPSPSALLLQRIVKSYIECRLR